MLKRSAFLKTIFVGAILASTVLAGIARATPDGQHGGRDITAPLMEALAEARYEADVLRARLESLHFGVYGRQWTPDMAPGSLDATAMADIRLLDVNRELRMVILSGGRREGLRPGMRFVLMRESRSTAQVLVTDVRDAVSGAVIEKEESRRMVSSRDKPVLLRGAP